MVLSLVPTACQPAAPTQTIPAAPQEPTTQAPVSPTTAAPSTEKQQQEKVKPATEAPVYGGVLTTALGADPTIMDCVEAIGRHVDLFHSKLWMGDWAKGPAGGYGTNDTDWLHSYDDPKNDKGFIAESVKWTVDETKKEGTIVAQIRQGIHYGVNPALEASRLVNGRELTADDVVYVLNYTISQPRSYLYKTNLELRTANISKTGPWEVTMRIPLEAMSSAINRFLDGEHFYPPEVMQKYGKISDWKMRVGTGPFMQTDYVPGSLEVFSRNPNYFEKDPVGPGKGNQLPYLDGVRRLIIPDASTRQAALRTGKLDHMAGYTWEDANMMRKQVPALKEVERTSDSGKSNSIWMRTDKAPFSDVRVRRAMAMAIDYQSIVDSVFGGTGQIVTLPYAYTKGYGDTVFSGLDDPEMPASVKELFSYNPEKAKALLKEAGYPNGFKTSIVTSTGSWGGVPNVDYFSIIKDMWSKVGIDLSIDIKDTGTLTTILTNRTHEALAASSESPVATFYLGIAYQGTGRYNLSMLNDPVINSGLAKVRLAALTDLTSAMKLYKKEITTYVNDQAYAISTPVGSQFTFWWPWVKGYSGEAYIGYDDAIWYYYVWYDQSLKKSMGY